jgi:hypothetical protein
MQHAARASNLSLPSMDAGPAASLEAAGTAKGAAHPVTLQEKGSVAFLSPLASAQVALTAFSCSIAISKQQGWQQQVKVRV